MRKGEEDKTQPRILYSCYAHISRDGEQFVPEHIFSYIVSGSQVIYSGGKTYNFKEGDFRFFRKNQLSRFVKQPPPGGDDIFIYTKFGVWKKTHTRFLM